MILSADMNVGLLIMIAWVVISFLGGSKKKKGQAGEGFIPPRRPSGLSQLFRDIGKQFEEAANQKVELRSEVPVAEEFHYADIIAEIKPQDPLVAPTPVEKPAIRPGVVQDSKNGGTPKTEDIQYAKPPLHSVCIDIFSEMADVKFLKKAIILQEIMGRPRAMRPYSPGFRK